ncbi:MAG: S41 family peptidase [Chitinophagales bacterium]|jgi:carboxyl-terminal processing protease|nr:S41 family peptidase [Sphingobacteriales bacterium]
MKKLMFFLILLSVDASAQDKAEKSFEKFKQYYSLLYSFYVDSVDFHKIVETSILKSLETLDPHSAYLPPKEASSENDRLQGSFEGIGISYNIIRDTLNIGEVIAGGPSEKIGLMPGDKMLMINDTLWAGKSSMKAEDYVSRLRGKKGTKVKVTLLRNKDVINFTITRDIIPLHSVDASFMIDNSIGYIKLNKFAHTTPYEIDTAMKKLKAQGMKSLILDLQNNGGGLLNASVALCNEFLEADRLVVYTEGEKSPKTEYKTDNGGNFKEGKLIVLVNESSASASEIVSGAIQEWDRGLIVGRRTFGKGLVQRPFTLNDNSQIRLTTAKYFTPSGRCIQKPFSSDRKEYRSDIYSRMNSGELTNEDMAHLQEGKMKIKKDGKDTIVIIPASEIKYTSTGRKVFGSGGVTPDVFVPIDTTMNTEYYFKFLRKGVLFNYAQDYVTANKVKLLSTYPNEDYFVKTFRVDKETMNGLLEKGVKEDILREDSSFQKSEKLFQVVLKANIARYLYNSQAFYKVLQEIDPMIIRAVALTKENFSKYKVRNE